MDVQVYIIYTMFSMLFITQAFDGAIKDHIQRLKSRQLNRKSVMIVSKLILRYVLFHYMLSNLSTLMEGR